MRVYQVIPPHNELVVPAHHLIKPLLPFEEHSWNVPLAISMLQGKAWVKLLLRIARIVVCQAI
jgi:hypothetical protein